MNDALKKCPRCGAVKQACDHLERVVANKLRGVGTGVLNIDMLGRYLWAGSMGQRSGLYGRTVFIELKAPDERDKSESAGLHNTYRDITGTLTTLRGEQFEQRGFILAYLNGDLWKLSTYAHPYVHGVPMTLDAAIDAIHKWLREGELPEVLAQGPAA